MMWDDVMAWPSFARHMSITGTLEVLTPLHVGSGEDERDEAIDKPPGEDKHAYSTRVQRDVLNRPYIPGTTTKGVLRSIAEKSGTIE